MSHKATNWAFEQRGLRPAAKVVLMYLADCHHPDFGCFPSQDWLSVRCEISRSGLNLVLAELEEKGLIFRKRRINPETRKQLSTRYILGFEDDFPQKPSPNSGHGSQGEPCPKIGDSRVQNLDTNPVREPVITTTDLRAEAEQIGARCLAVCGPGLSPHSRATIRASDEVIDGWLEQGFDLELDVLPVLAKRTASAAPPDRVVRTWDYFSAAIGSAHRRRKAQAERLKGAEERAWKNRPAPTAAAAPVENDYPLMVAEWITGGKFVPSSAVTPRVRRAMLERGLVTEQQLRERGIR